MQPERFESRRHRRTVDDGAAAHCGKCARAPRPCGKETEDEHPEKRRLKPTEREHIDEPDERRRRNGKHEHDDAERGGDTHREPAQRLFLDELPALLLMVEVDILHHRRRGNDKHARDGGDRCRQGADDSKSEEFGGHDLCHELRDDTVHTAESLCIDTEHPASEYTDEIHGDVHKGDDDGANDHRAVHIAAAPIADAAHNGLWQGNRERTHEQPLRDIERDGHTSRRRRCQHLGMCRTQMRENLRKPSTRLKYIVKQQNDAEHHDNRTAGIRQCNGTESTDRRIDNDHNAEQHQTELVAVARDGGKELRPADELCDHRRGKENHDGKCCECRKRVRLIAVTDDIDNGDSVDAPRQTRDLLAEDAEHEEDRHGLDDRHVDPAKADLVRHTRSADKRADRAVGRDHRHREHERAERLPADEVAREEAARVTLPPHIDAEREHCRHEAEERQEHHEIAVHRATPSPRSSRGTSSAANAR